MNRIIDGSTDYISRIPLGEEYFENIDTKTISMDYSNGIVYMFHSKGAVLYMPERGIGFVDLTQGYEGSYHNREDEVMFVSGGGIIQGLFEGDENTEMLYETGVLTLNEPDRTKDYEKLEFFGKGTVTTELFLDGELKTTMTMNLDGQDRDRVIFFPRGFTGRGASFRTRGKGTITEVKYWLFDE